VLTWVKTFFATLEKNGFTDYVLYSYMPYLNANLPKNHKLGNIRLWIAQYRQKLTLPDGWDSSWMWQYSDSGSINGIAGKTDLNKQ
jgi:GH25 family lysozyme M1 (1,4-beta-N-acetylmuramidase)